MPALLEVQHPDLAGMTLVEVAAGWDNFVFRLGDDLAVRLPRRAIALSLVEREQRWLPAPALQLPLPCPCVSVVQLAPFDLCCGDPATDLSVA